MTGFLKVKFSGAVSRALQSRHAKWSQRKAMGARVVVPPELAWWYYQEFGTAGKNESGEANSSTYTIEPVKGNKLTFMWEGVLTDFGIVENHPGVRPAGFVRKALPTIQQEIHRKLGEVLRKDSVDSPEALQSALLHSMQFAKEEITTSMAAQLGHFQDGDDPAFGKLEGRQPEDVFRANATIEKIE